LVADEPADKVWTFLSLTISKLDTDAPVGRVHAAVPVSVIVNVSVVPAPPSITSPVLKVR
jgi:hypothetical protein